ncbi:hypothetical protein J7E32_07135 [Bacillus sp. ISL-55]|nr:hypothetical protein [Bacillus sp. ISL-55]
MDEGAINRIERAIFVLYRAMNMNERAIIPKDRANTKLNNAIIIFFIRKTSCFKGVFILRKST